MQLNVLLVEDEPGIRDGLASFLRLKGMRVTTAGSRSEGLSKLAQDDYDIVVTDWRLGDGLGADIVAASNSPVVIASGVPEEVDVPTTVDDGRNVCVVPKPVMPAQLVDKIEALIPEIPSADSGRQPWEDPALPTDTRDRVRLLLALAGDPAQPEVIDDGSFVTVEAPLTRAQEAHVLGSMAAMERVCGDIRVLGDSTPLLQARFYRDSRDDEASCLVSPSDPWPAECARLAIDFDRSPCSPARFLELVEQARETEQNRRSVAFLNVPSHLRLYLEVLGRPHDMPKRGRAGPHLPEVLTELWR